MIRQPWFAPIIVLFWAVSTGWLVVHKIMPMLAPGSPPGYKAFYASGSRMVPVAWSVTWNDRPVGWASSECVPQDDGGCVVETRLRFERLPLDDMLPRWTTMLIGGGLPQAAMLTLDTRGRLSIDKEGQLRRFTSVVSIPEFNQTIFLTGTNNAGHVRIRLHGRNLEYETERHLPESVMLGDELSPQATMPGLTPDRRWTVPVYSPLKLGGSPMEILHAHVEREEPLFWEDRYVRTRLVVYRDDPTSRREPKCRMWVDQSGRVLRQESAVLGSRLAFVRQSDEAARELVGKSAEEIFLQEQFFPIAPVPPDIQPP